MVTTTNLPGALAFSIPVEAAAQGSAYKKAFDPVRAIMVSAQNTATTIATPTEQTDAMRLIHSGLDKLGHSPARSTASGVCERSVRYAN